MSVFRHILMALLVVVGLSGCVGQVQSIFMPCFVRIDNGRWEVEVARSEEEREKGLMFRKFLPENKGMLFVFDKPRKVMMWMKNTYITLDMVFVDAQGIVTNIEEHALPLSEDIIRSRTDAAYVLELAAGQAEKTGIKIGDTLELSECPALSPAK